MSIVLILKCEKSEGEKSIFTPLARWENNSWVEINIPEQWIKVPDEYRPPEYKEKILSNQKYEVDSLVLAKIIDEKTLQIQQPFCGLVETDLDITNLPEKVPVRDHYNWNEKRIYFYSESQNVTVGPYLIKKIKDEWIAYAEIREGIYLEYYKYLEDVIDSKYYFDKDEKLGDHFLPDEIGDQKLIVISDIKLFKHILNILSKHSDISEACDKIKSFINQSGGLSVLLGNSFNYNIDDIKDKFSKILTDDMKRKGELLQEVLGVLKEHSAIKSEIEKYKQAECVKEEKKIRQELEVDRQVLIQQFEKEEQELKQKSEEKRLKIKENSEREIDGIEKQVNKKKENLKLLKDFEEKKRKELSEYILKGEKWRNALYPRSDYNVASDENEILILPEWDDQAETIDRHSDDDNIARINQTINQLSQKRIYRISGFEDLEGIESFFDSIGHRKSRFVLNADASWLTPKSLWQTKGYLSEHDKLITLTDLFKLAEKNEKFIFQVEILGADRAPIEGYFGPLLKAMERKKSLVAEDVLLNIPDNILFFLQLDQDEYSAKPSNWLKNKLNFIEFPVVQDMPLKIAIPANVLLKKEE